MFIKWNKLKKRASRSLSAFYDYPLAPPTSREKELIEELQSAFRALPEEAMTSSSTAEQEWIDNVRRLKELVLNDDPREFLRWDVILRTMSVTYVSYLSTELRYLRSLPDWEYRWCQVIEECPVGHPIPHWQYPRSSGNLIHHSYHVAQFQEKTGMRVDKICFVFEFGGGYGSVCRVFHNLGFKGKYLIFDLPSFSKLQEFFLKSIGITVVDATAFESGGNGVLCISDLEQLREILSDNKDDSDSMFVATWSISESPVSLREAVLPLVSGFKGLLVAYQDRFREMNNIDFFKQWSSSLRGFEWKGWKLDHLPNNNRYLVAVRSSKDTH